MALVRVGADDKGVVALQEALGKFITDLIRFLRRDFAGTEGLAHLIGDNIAVLSATGHLKILALGECKLRVGSIWVAGVGTDAFAGVRLVGIPAIIQPVEQALPDGFAFVQMQGNNASGRHGFCLLVLDSKKHLPRSFA